MGVLEFLFEVVTDFSVLPSLALIFWRKKHFEFFMGIMQMFCSLMYNICDSLEVPSIFLRIEDWHRLTNVTGLSYGVNVLVYLLQNESEGVDHLMRYSAFALLWIAQLKDEFWMHETQYTLLVLGLLLVFSGVMLLKRRSGGTPMSFDGRRVKFGAGFSAGAFIMFLASLDDHSDPWRFKHGLAQLLFGAALFHLWQVVPRAKYKAELPM